MDAEDHPWLCAGCRQHFEDGQVKEELAAFIRG